MLKYLQDQGLLAETIVTGLPKNVRKHFDVDFGEYPKGTISERNRHKTWTLDHLKNARAAWVGSIGKLPDKAEPGNLKLESDSWAKPTKIKVRNLYRTEVSLDAIGAYIETRTAVAKKAAQEVPTVADEEKGIVESFLEGIGWPWIGGEEPTAADKAATQESM